MLQAIQEAVKRRFFKENLFKMDEIITNGDKDTNEIKNNSQILKEKIHKLGNIRFDVLKSPYNKIIKEEAKTIKKEFKNFNSFATQFGRANPVNIRNIASIGYSVKLLTIIQIQILR